VGLPGDTAQAHRLAIHKAMRALGGADGLTGSRTWSELGLGSSVQTCQR